jgi:flagellar assembly factor FliW
MKFDTTRFGAIEAPETDLIHFARGIIGFPNEKSYVLIPHATSTAIAWLQSTTTPDLAFPVVSAHAFDPEYPDVGLPEIVSAAGLGEVSEDVAVLVVLSAVRGQPATVNLLAPLVINSKTRMAAQLFLDGSRYSTRELFMLPKVVERSAELSAQAQAVGM